MATVEFNIKDFRKLLGQDMSLDEMRERIPMMGVAWDHDTEESFTIEVEPNRPDFLSVEGVVRNLKGILGIEKGLIKYEVHDSKETLKVKKSVKGIREHIVMGIVKNIDIDEDLLKSIIQIQEKLHITHGRRRKKVAIGIHDYDKVKGPFTYECVKPESVKFIPLDMNQELNLKEILQEHPKGKDYSWILETFEKYPLITDSNGSVLSFPPIINGELTRVTEKTKNLLIDITGTDEIAVNQALNILMALFHDRGGELFSVKIKHEDKEEKITPNLEYWKMELNLDYARKISGLDIKKNEVKDLLEKMRYGVEEKDDKILIVHIPPYRTDIMHQYDLIEDLVIAYGYDNVKELELSVATESGLKMKEVLTDKIRELMIGFGLNELLTFSLTNKNKLYKMMNTKKMPTVEIENALNNEYSCLRTWLLPGLMETLSINNNKPYPQKVFEIDDCVVPDKNEDTGAKDIRKLAVAIADVNADYTLIKALFDSFAELLDLNVEFKETKNGSFIEGRVASIHYKGKEIGFLGEIHPQVLNNFDIEVPVVALEIELDEILKEKM